MVNKVKICKNYREKMAPPFYGYRALLKDGVVECPLCHTKLEEIDFDSVDFFALWGISKDLNFIESMIDLKKTDPIEFELKMNQFRLQSRERGRQLRLKNKEEANVPKCPTCRSTNINKKISSAAKAANTGLFGIFGTKRNKTFHCNNCGHEW